MAYSFVSFLRRGIANAISNIADLSAGGNPNTTNGARAVLDVTVNITYNGALDPLSKKKIELYGPGDISGIDKKVIIRTDPLHYTTNFEPNYLASIEFYDEDFPWRFTPAAAAAFSAKLTPWLALVVLEETEIAGEPGITQGINGPLPSFVLSNKADPAAIFPPPQSLWAWAHAHINKNVLRDENNNALDNTGIKGSVRDVLDEDGDYCYSRIICPRRLKTGTAYHAFLIPSFETGRLAGLGKQNEVDGTPINKCSWADFAPKVFPYYYTWYFRTGAMGDFEYLVNQLKHKPADTRVGYREMLVDEIKEGANPKVLYLPGALRVPLNTMDENRRKQIENYENWEGAQYPHPWQKGIAEKKLRINVTEEEPVITMPVYGQWHARVEEILYKKGTNEILPDAKLKDWVHELNLDPRYRAVAALGTKVIQQQQEEYMDVAWQQIDKIREANKAIRLAQLAIELNKVFQKKVLGRFSAEQLLAFTTPLHKKVNMLVGGSPTIYKTWDASAVPNAVGTGLFRKLARNTWRVASVGRNVKQVFAVSSGNLNTAFKATMHKEVPAGAATFFQFETTVKNYYQSHPQFLAMNAANRTSALASLKSAFWYDSNYRAEMRSPGKDFKLTQGGGIYSPLVGTIGLGFANTMGAGGSAVLLAVNAQPPASSSLPSALQTSPLTNAQLFANATENTQKIYDLQSQIIVVASVPVNLPVASTSILAGINAQDVLRMKFIKKFRNLRGRIPVQGLWQVPVMVYPVFKLPMYEELKKLSVEYFLPNINLVEQNTITLLETNQRFIESYMVGLNHEMSRELLWRGFPTDQRGSYFRRFWNSIEEDRYDINEIHKWDHKLGMNGEASNSGLIVLVVRGDLLKKYPNTVITAQKADWGEKNNVKNITVNRALKTDADIFWPIFEAIAEPDIYFFGFNIIENGRAVDEAGLRGTVNATNINTDNPGWFFVLQERPGQPRFGLDTDVVAHPQKWNQLSWSDVEVAEGKITDFKKEITVSNDPDAKWPPGDSAQLAYILYQQPVLIAVHASRLLKQNPV